MVRLVTVALALMLGLVACGEDFVSVQKEDTIEGYEKFQAENPTSIYNEQINSRLEELYGEKAKADNTVESWEAYLNKFPKGKKAKEAMKYKEDSAWDATEAAATTEAYKDFLVKFPTPSKEHKDAADQMIAIGDYGKLVVGEPKVEKMNAAEDPKGPLNVWGLKVDVKNDGPTPIDYLVLEARFFGSDNTLIEGQEYAFVTPPGSNRMPHPEIEEKPLAPGETRTWTYMATDKVGIDTTPTAKVRAVGIQLGK
jgi:hypothetical protein